MKCFLQSLTLVLLLYHFFHLSLDISYFLFIQMFVLPCFCGTGVWTQGLMLASHRLYNLWNSSSPCMYFIIITMHSLKPVWWEPITDLEYIKTGMERSMLAPVIVPMGEHGWSIPHHWLSDFLVIKRNSSYLTYWTTWGLIRWHMNTFSC
jgi:hypothetical protein